MLDAQFTPQVPHTVRLSDYRPPDWLVPTVALDFDLAPGCTRVRATLTVTRNGAHDRPLVLDGQELRLLSLTVDGVADATQPVGEHLTLRLAGDTAVIETLVEIVPSANTRLMGLYASGGNLCTQCEAEGFRRITFFPDRPDVLSTYSVRMKADARAYPVLLANGNMVARGDDDGGDTHWAEWTDPWPKPCYLFALVAGDLQPLRDRFTTMSGREVQLAIWTAAADVPRCAHAMAALKTSMAWDEVHYGREYDLDVFNIVAVADFNFGAMENKGLNVFNSKYILADPETATDADFDAVAAVVAHEYFHNWTGNRITCRDWFQLSLKEGLTVFRDQQFSGDQGSRAVRRIDDVRSLRAVQFQEDAGPTAHPIRPDHYIEIGNFYTATVYNKGAEVIRMLYTLLGEAGFRAGTDLYFERHDGQAVTCEDFVRAMEDASGRDLTQFRRWYEQAGTPRVGVTLAHEGSTATITLTQTTPPTPGQPIKLPVHLPLRLALFDRASGARIGDERLVELTEATTTVVIPDVPTRPVLSLNRDFSAPVIVEHACPAADRVFLSAHDDDPFARYEALQQLALDTLSAEGPCDDLVAALGATLGGDDPAFIAEAVLLPTEAFIGDQAAVVAVDAIHARREAVRHAAATAHRDAWWAAYRGNADAAYAQTPEAKGRRRLKNVALGYLMATGEREAEVAAYAQFENANNMTDRIAALSVLANSDAPERTAALAAFYDRFKGDASVIDKWFSVQAMSSRADTLAATIALTRHPDFSHNPNRLRSLVGAFGVNQLRLHAADGAGYAFLADQVLSVDPVNPSTAARLMTPLGRWRRFDEGRAALMRAQLQRLLKTPRLSKDVFEMASKSLA
ncbi:aminopeptidase N [Glacieibacterium frigidum]|uniref:Aminopeptidase N n=1 Tax=Glacieibacterium frigidum TaxID=2593303 RepID=A0A552UJK7_9SPHN|nr:aminopeptidase N [Glacieibacterium frigidum]TRW18370.1 aminopeptidase N [Glacieibacterium frigidum]